MKVDFTVRYVEMLASGDMLKLGTKLMADIKMGRVAVCRGTEFVGMLLTFKQDGRTLNKLLNVQGFRLPLLGTGCVDVDRHRELLFKKVQAGFGYVLPASGPVDSFEISWVPTLGQVVKACQLYGLYEGVVLSPADAEKLLK